MADVPTAEMARQRALLTDTERAILSGSRDVKDNYRYSVESRVRSRITGPFAEDIAALRENYPELLEELERVVVDTESDSEGGEGGVTATTSTGGENTSDTSRETPAGGVRDHGRRDAAEERLRDLGLPGQGSLLDERVETILELYDHLRDRPGGAVPTRELRELVDAERVGYDSVESFWSNCIRGSSGRTDRGDALDALPGVENLGNGSYRYNAE